ncbi:MAG: type II toxin-antitoxin system Phd/YefM family antitoxin [Desulfuromonadales bacterium]
MVNITAAEARSHFSRYINMVDQQHEKIVIEKRGRKVALIIPFPDTGVDTSHHAVPSLAALDALPSRSDTFIGIVKEADLDYRSSRTEYLLTKYS